MNHPLRAALVSAFLVASIPAFAQYRVDAIGKIPGYSGAYGYSVNGSGDVAGRADGGPLRSRGFVYSNGTLTDIGSLPGGIDTVAYDLNDYQQVTGTAFGPQGWRAFIYDHGSMQSLAAPAGNSGSEGQAINNLGEVVGFVNFGGSQVAYKFAGDAAMALPTLPGHTTSVAYDIADNGAIVGSSGAGGGFQQGFLLRDGTLTAIGPANSVTRAWALNESGVVVGTTNATGISRAFTFQGDAMTVLPVLAGALRSEAMDVNEYGDVVGYMGTASESVALLWHNGLPVSLNELLGPASVYRLAFADGINDAGQIVAYGRNLATGEIGAYLLTPVPENSTLVMMAFGAFVILRASRRQVRLRSQ